MTPSDFYKKQYELVCDSRTVLFDYCKTISQEHFLKEQTSFGRGGSIRNLLVHIANTYQFWIGKEFLKKEIAFEYTSVTNIDGVVQLFSTIDILMQAFFVAIKQKEDLAITLTSILKIAPSHLNISRMSSLMNFIIKGKFYH